MKELMYRSRFLDLGINWSGQLHSPGRFVRMQIFAGIDQIGGWVGTSVGQDEVEKILDPIRDSNFDPSFIQPVASLYNDRAIAAIPPLVLKTVAY
jgi:hypothetical protein